MWDALRQQQLADEAVLKDARRDRPSSAVFCGFRVQGWSGLFRVWGCLGFRDVCGLGLKGFVGVWVFGGSGGS